MSKINQSKQNLYKAMLTDINNLMAKVAIAPWQTTLFDSLTPLLSEPETVDITLSTANEPANTVINASQLPDPLINKVRPVPEFPASVIRTDVDKNDLVYNLRRMND